jgi:hypothetical protein
MKYSTASPTLTGIEDVKRTPEELRFRISPAIL